MENRMKVGVFSGRFDPPNAGHFMTIASLMQTYDRLIVPILDYKERFGCSAAMAKKIFEHHFTQVLSPVCRNKVEFVVNDVHFGMITVHQFIALLEDCGTSVMDVTYLAGNEDVLAHMKAIGIPSEYVPRVAIEGLNPYVFESTKIRKRMQDTGETLEEIYNLK